MLELLGSHEVLFLRSTTSPPKEAGSMGSSLLSPAQRRCRREGRTSDRRKLPRAEIEIEAINRASASEGRPCEFCGTKLEKLPEGLTQFRFHDLRHTAVTRMIVGETPLPCQGCGMDAS